MKTEILTQIDKFPVHLKDLCDSYPDMDRSPDFPVRISGAWAERIRRAEGPLFLQAVPAKAERMRTKQESSDPLAEEQYTVSPGLVHRYRDRVLLLLTDNCDMHCRHCFRRAFSGLGQGRLSAEHLHKAAEYIKADSNIHEIILSGGDPLTLSPGQHAEVFSILNFPGRNIVYRIGTRVPVVSPGRIDKKLLDVLSKIKPLWLMLQINHADELYPESIRALESLRKAGLTLLNQTVLLKGVNDNVETLKRLCHALIENSIKPYYIFQGDLAGGTSRFRVSLKRGMEIIRELRRRISGIAMPVYAVDLPGGGGKIPLTESYFQREENGLLIFENQEGKEFSYPIED